MGRKSAFRNYYHVAKSEAQWIDETACNRHENETMWYGNNLPDDVFSTEDHLACERAAIAAILHNTFGITARIGLGLMIWPATNLLVSLARYSKLISGCKQKAASRKNPAMKISEVQINLIKPKEGLIGFAALVINDDFYLSGIGIHRKIDGTGYRLTYPSRKSGRQNFEIFHAIKRVAGQLIEDAVFQRLKDVLNKLEKSHAGYSRSDIA